MQHTPDDSCASQRPLELPARLLSQTDAAEVLGVSVGTVLRLTKRGELRSFRVAGRRVIHPVDLVTYINRCRDLGTKGAV